jgi:hypothetical protein
MPTPNRIPTTPKAQRKNLTRPLDADTDAGYGGDLAAVEAIRAAHLACNSSITLASEYAKFSPMRLLARSAVEALALLPGVGHAGAERIWQEMGENGESAAYNYDLWRDGVI